MKVANRLGGNSRLNTLRLRSMENRKRSVMKRCALRSAASSWNEGSVQKLCSSSFPSRYTALHCRIWYALSSSSAMRHISRHTVWISATRPGVRMLSASPSDGLSSDTITGIPPIWQISVTDSESTVMWFSSRSSVCTSCLSPLCSWPRILPKGFTCSRSRRALFRRVASDSRSAASRLYGRSYSFSMRRSRSKVSVASPGANTVSACSGEVASPMSATISSGRSAGSVVLSRLRSVPLMPASTSSL
mmetsp:Transcript_14567/g.36888  ORF Transcript_14567/g.36888 Transcript_14567/m.36888 type:complete len:247 (-) Transcript_14567:223-963(-)